MNYLNNLKYVADTFEGLRDGLKEVAKLKLGTSYEEFGDDDMATLILEWMAYVGASISWTSDRKLSDNIMELTRSLKIASYMAEGEGMKLSGRTPQNVAVTLENTGTDSVTILEGSTVKTSSGDFLVTSSYEVPAGGTVEIIAIEAIKESVALDSDGTVFQSFDLNSYGIDIAESIVYQSMEITHSPDDDDAGDNSEWKEVDFLPHNSDSDENENRYFSIDYVNHVVKFGDGITGAILPKGTVHIDYYLTRGLSQFVPVLRQGDVSYVYSPETDTNYPNVEVISNGTGYGASNGDLNLSQIKSMFKSFKRSKTSIVNLEDYEYHALSATFTSGKVAKTKAHVWREAEENPAILNIKTEMSVLFNSFLAQIDSKYESLREDVISLRSELNSLKTFTQYIKSLSNNVGNKFNELKSVYNTSMEVSKNAMRECKNLFISAIENSDNVPTHFYDFSTERGLMDSSFSSFNVLIKSFENLSDESGKTLDDYISSFNARLSSLKFDLEAFIEEKYSMELSVLFNNLNSEIQKILYAPETVRVINLVVLSKDENENYVSASPSLIQELYLYFNRKINPLVILNIQDGYSSIINNRVQIKVKIKEVETGYSMAIVKNRVLAYLNENYQRLDFGEGISLYSITNEIESNVAGVEKAGVIISEVVPEGDEPILDIDDYGDLDMSNNQNRLIQGIRVIVE